jgi:hypothetical protein
VVTAIAWVSPRVKRTLPCVLGKRPQRDEIGRTSVSPLPSARTPSSRTRFLMMLASNRCTFGRAKVRANSSTTYYCYNDGGIWPSESQPSCCLQNASKQNASDSIHCTASRTEGLCSIILYDMGKIPWSNSMQAIPVYQLTTYKSLNLHLTTPSVDFRRVQHCFSVIPDKIYMPGVCPVQGGLTMTADHSLFLSSVSISTPSVLLCNFSTRLCTTWVLMASTAAPLSCLPVSPPTPSSSTDPSLT